MIRNNLQIALQDYIVLPTEMLIFHPAEKRQSWRHKIMTEEIKQRLTRGGKLTWCKAAGSPSKSLPIQDWQKTEKQFFVTNQVSANESYTHQSGPYPTFLAPTPSVITKISFNLWTISHPRCFKGESCSKPWEQLEKLVLLNQDNGTKKKKKTTNGSIRVVCTCQKEH